MLKWVLKTSLNKNKLFYIKFLELNFSDVKQIEQTKGHQARKRLSR